MSHKYKAKYLGELYFITVTIVDWVDLLTRPIYKDTLGSSHCKCLIERVRFRDALNKWARFAKARQQRRLNFSISTLPPLQPIA